MPIALPAQSRQYRLIPWGTKLNKLTDTPSCPAPLLPVAHADAPTQPMIHLNGIVILQSNTEVVHPSLKIGTDFPAPVVHRDAPTTTSEAAHFGFKPREGFLGDSKPFACEGEPEKGTLLGLHHLAFVPIDPEANLGELLKPLPGESIIVSSTVRKFGSQPKLPQGMSTNNPIAPRLLQVIQMPF